MGSVLVVALFEPCAGWFAAGGFTRAFSCFHLAQKTTMPKVLHPWPFAVKLWSRCVGTAMSSGHCRGTDAGRLSFVVGGECAASSLASRLQMILCMALQSIL